MAMGTPDYVAPEVLTMGVVVDHRADLYAVGVMLYQMLTGEVPRGMFKMPSEKGIGSDPRFDDIICKAMEQDREERYQTAGDVRRSLDEILTTPQPKNDDTGVVPVEALPKRVVLNVPGGSIERSAGTLAGGAIARSQGPPPKKAPGKNVAVNGAPGKSSPGKSSRAPVRKSSTELWLTVAGVIAALAVAAFFVLGSKPKAVAAPADASTASQPTKPQVPVKVPGNPPTAPSATKGKTIDLLAMVDVKRDVIAGEWVRTADGLAKQGPGSTDNGAVRLQLPYQPPEEYDFEIEFTPADGFQSFGLILSTQSRTFSWLLSGGKEGEPVAGFEMFDSKAASALTEVATPMEKKLEGNRRYRSRVEVRSGVLRAFLDDKLLVSWSGDVKRLAPDAAAKLRDKRYLGLRAARDVTFHKVTVREITGTGKMDAAVASVPTPSSPIKGPAIDLLALVDVKRDVVAGEWCLDGDDLLVKAATAVDNGKGTPRLQLPYAPPEEYDFEIEFTPETGTSNVYQILSAHQRSFAWVLDVDLQTGMKAGFDRIDGRAITDRITGTTMRPKFLTNGQRHRSTVEVRKTEVRGLLDGAEIVSYGKSIPDVYETLDSTPDEALRDTLHLGLAVRNRAMRIHKVTVREVTGTGTVDEGTVKSTSPSVANSNAPPSITNWRDVTGDLREKARSKPGLLVEPDAIRLEPGNEQPLNVAITDVPARSLAVRVAYTGQAQISLWFKESVGSVFVLARQKETIFNRVDEVKTTVALRPPVPNPADFDNTAPHELLLAVQDSVLRAWIDGRFIGEVQNDLFKEVGMALAITKLSAVRKVEIAE
jgi:hypothetical protein